MCGIAGTWGRPAAEVDGARVARMLAAMRHRGPDGEGSLAYPGGAAGMVRLALVDLSARGQQPLWSEDGRVAILWNGEHYGFRPQRARLAAAGYPFRSTTDTEVVLASYLERGLEFVHDLRGMYAVAIFDFREAGRDAPPRLVLARDPLGMKPLYLARRGESLAFASELRGLLASGLVAPEVDRAAVASYLAHGFVLPPRTIFAGVTLLAPGTLIVHDPGRPAVERTFWTTPPAAPRDESLASAAGRLRETIETSIQLHSMADAPVGAFLSGGIDSTGIVGLMRRHVPSLRTYTLNFPDVPGDGEAALAAGQAARLGCVHTTIDVEGTEVAALLPTFARALDQPSTDGLNSWLVARGAARDVRGVLSGIGGDEFFAGYPVARRMARAMTRRGRVLGAVGRSAHVLGLRSPLARSLAARRSPLGLWLQTHGVFGRDEVQALAGLALDPEAAVEQRLDADEPTWRHETAVGLAATLDARYYMGGQLLRDCDATSMAHSLELRMPFCDVEVARCARTIADRHKLAAGGGSSLRYGDSGAKRVLIEALRDVLPPEILARPKRGFALPLDVWLRGPARGVVDDCLAPETVRARGLVDPDAVAALTGGGGAEADAPYPRAWSLVVLELWARAVLDAARGAA